MRRQLEAADGRSEQKTSRLFQPNLRRVREAAQGAAQPVHALKLPQAPSAPPPFIYVSQLRLFFPYLPPISGFT